MLNLWADGKDDPEMVGVVEEMKEEGKQLFLSVVEEEKAWADYLFKDGSMLGLNADILKQYVEYMANLRLTALQ